MASLQNASKSVRFAHFTYCTREQLHQIWQLFSPHFGIPHVLHTCSAGHQRHKVTEIRLTEVRGLQDSQSLLLGVGLGGAHIVLAVECLPVVGQREHDLHTILRSLIQHKVQAPEGCLVVDACSSADAS